jgi:hypothetical protein
MPCILNCCEAKLTNLELKTRLKQLLGPLQLDTALPPFGRCCKTFFSLQTHLHISVQLPKSSVKLGFLYNIVVNGGICTAFSLSKHHITLPLRTNKLECLPLM